MRGEWRVIIVEDDRSVAELHHRLVVSVKGFEVIGTATTGATAIRAIRRLAPDLVLLDLALPGIDGATVLRHLRASGSPVEVIAVTASRHVDTVRDTIHLGAVDYLVKPFAPERLRLALTRFLHRMAALEEVNLSQAAVDEARVGGGSARRWLPRGLAEETLGEVRELLGASADGVTADIAAAALGVARVTVRRYLEYLVASGDVSVRLVTDGPGRPRRLYQSLPSGRMLGASNACRVGDDIDLATWGLGRQPLGDA